MKKLFTALKGLLLSPFKAITESLWPLVPAVYPPRHVRRAVKHNRPVPQEWEAHFKAHPKVRAGVAKS